MTLEARLDELERRLTEIEAEWSRPEVAVRPRAQPLARTRAGPDRADRRELPAPAPGPRAARRGPARTRDARPTRSCANSLARSWPSSRPRRRARRAHPRSSSCHTTRTTSATSSSRSAAAREARRPSLFASDLMRMYLRYAERRGWKTEPISASESGVEGPPRGHLRDRAGRAPTAGSSTRAASIASSASRRPSRAAASTPRPRPSRCCRRPTRSTSTSTRTRTCASRSSAPRVPAASA